MIGFAALSHLGLVSSAAIAARGFPTVAFDPDPALVAAIVAGRLPVREPGLRELIAQARPAFTADVTALSACDVVYVALDVPTDDVGQSDLGPLEKLIDLIWPHVRRDATLVVLSQVSPGFTRRLESRRARSADEPGGVYYQVETLIFGSAVQRAQQPERYMVGCADPVKPLPPAFRDELEAFGCPILPMRYESAELAKISINLFLVSSISTTNMLAELCERIGADWSEIAPALRLDARIGPKAYLTPGLGIGGGNLGRDLETVKRLSNAHGTDTRIVDAWRINSTYRCDWALRLLHETVLADRPDAVLALWGFAYKPHTASTKNSPAVSLLGSLGPHRVTVYDPAAQLERARFPQAVQASDALSAARGADVLLVMTPWPEFWSVPLDALQQAMRGRTIIDPYSALDGAGARALGFTWRCLGAPAPAEF